jgi:Flp pilus assembly protein TadB
MAGGVSAEDLVGVRAALAAGASPGAALAEAGEGVLSPVVRAVRLGRSVAQEAATVDTGDLAADSLVRALGVAEHAGVGAGDAVSQAMHAIRDGVAMEQLLQVRTAQARVTATMLAVMPLGAWSLLVLMDSQTLHFYATPLGALLGGLAVLLAVAGRLWSAKLVRRASRAGADADPLVPEPPRRELGRALAAGLPTLVGMGVLAGPGVGVLAGVVVGAIVSRPKSTEEVPDTSSGGAAEATELVAVAVAAGLPTVAAVGAVSGIAPPAARGPLTDAARRLRGGWDPAAAFEGTGLAALGRTIATAERWGAPSVDALQELASDFRAARRAAAEEAAERVQVALIFPTTMLTLPSFVLGVVPPLLWTAFSGGVGLT